MECIEWAEPQTDRIDPSKTYYNRSRLHWALGYRPPEESEGKSEQDIGPELAASGLVLFEP
jgi:hypothetical protein